MIWFEDRTFQESVKAQSSDPHVSFRGLMKGSKKVVLLKDFQQFLKKPQSGSLNKVQMMVKKKIGKAEVAELIKAKVN